MIIIIVSFLIFTNTGFNCGEAANFATAKWLNFARDAAVRRAAMSYLPMLSHQQLLYMLAVSFVSRLDDSEYIFFYLYFYWNQMTFSISLHNFLIRWIWT